MKTERQGNIQKERQEKTPAARRREALRVEDWFRV